MWFGVLGGGVGSLWREVVDVLHINTMAKIFPAIKAKATDKGSRGDSSYEIFRVNEQNQLS